jgi:hypothetical protein
VTAAAAAAAPRVTGAPKRWTGLHTVALLVLLAAIGSIGILLPWLAGAGGAYGDARLGTWLVTLALMLALGLVVGHGVTGVWRGIVVDDRNRVSSSRLQLVLWTALVLSGYLDAILANVGLHASEPLLVDVPPALWAAMGVSTASLATSPLALREKKRQGKLTTNASPSGARWLDVVTGEEHGLENVIDLGKVQMVLVTVVLVLAYGVALGHALDSRGTLITSLPKVNEAFAILLGISHAGYLAKKRAPRLGSTRRAADAVG